MKSVTVQDLKAKIDNGEAFQLIDVREQYERDIINIDGEHFPMGDVLARKDEIKTDVPVIVHCRSGMRSASVIDALQREFGFENLYNLEGGVLAWAQEIDTTLEQY